MSRDTLDKQLAECFSVPHHLCRGLSSLHGRMDSDVELSTSTRPSPANQEPYVHPSAPLDSLWRSRGPGNRMTWVHSPFGLCLTQQRCPPFLLYARSLGSRVMLIGGAEYSRKSSHLLSCWWWAIALCLHPLPVFLWGTIPCIFPDNSVGLIGKPSH